MKRKSRNLKRFKDLQNKFGYKMKFPLPSEEINHKIYVKIPKVIFDSTEQRLSAGALNLFIVLLCIAKYKNFKNPRADYFAIDQTVLMRYAGVNKNMLNRLFTELLDAGGKFSVLPYLVKRKMVTEGKRHYYKYKVFLIRNIADEAPEDSINWKGETLPFSISIVLTGAWAELSLRAKLLYVGMLLNPMDFDTEWYTAAAEALGIDIDRKHVQYETRKFDIFHGWSIAQACSDVGISHEKIKAVLRQLKRVDLINRITNEYYAVWRQYHRTSQAVF